MSITCALLFNKGMFVMKEHVVEMLLTLTLTAPFAAHAACEKEFADAALKAAALDTSHLNARYLENYAENNVEEGSGEYQEIMSCATPEQAGTERCVDLVTSLHEKIEQACAVDGNAELCVVEGEFITSVMMSCERDDETSICQDFAKEMEVFMPALQCVEFDPYEMIKASCGAVGYIDQSDARPREQELARKVLIQYCPRV